MSGVLQSTDIADGLNTRRIGREVIVLDEIDSTNSHVLNVIAAQRGSSGDGVVVFAEHQTSGRGRLGRSWACPRGAGLTFSVLLWERAPEMSIARIIMSAALAVVRGVERVTDVEPSIRWPNDVMVGDRKLAGILVEARMGSTPTIPVAIGVGLNCLQQAGHFSAELQGRATSLEIESRHAVNRVAVARATLVELDALFGSRESIGDDVLTAAWRERCADIGSRITLMHGGTEYTGRVVEINPREGLLVQLDSGVCKQFDLASATRTAH